MKRIIHILIFIALLLQVSSCKWFHAFLHDEELVASVGKHKLYRSELNALMPKGLKEQDSVLLAQQYINSWASNYVFLNIAERQLSASERNVEDELEEYRKSLLRYRYEQSYINERLDTLITDALIEEYYNANSEKFILRNPVVKARYLSISKDSPALPKIRRKMVSEDDADKIEADSLAYSSAQKYLTWQYGWIDLSVLVNEFDLSEREFLDKMKSRWVEHIDTLGILNLAYITDIVYTGNKAPIDYCSQRIKDIIISTRKHTMLTELEKELVKEARRDGSFQIY